MKPKICRLGRFIRWDLLDVVGSGPEPERDPVLRAIFAECVVIKADYSISDQGIEFWAYSPQFDAIPTGETYRADQVPRYGWTVSLAGSVDRPSAVAVARRDGVDQVLAVDRITAAAYGARYLPCAGPG